MISLTHQFQSAKADGPDRTQVQPSNWNANHVLNMATARLVGRATAGTGAAEEIALGNGLMFSGSTLALATNPIVAGNITVSGNLVVSGSSQMTGAVGVGGSASASALLDIQSVTKGVLFPRMTTAQRDAIVAPAAGLVIYNTTTARMEFFSGTWQPVSPPAPDGVPAGAVMNFAMNSPPTGWLKANGALVSRATYAALFAAIGTTFGAGDGSTTFSLPDLRGEFARGWDDGRGVDAGRVFGSAQLDQMQRLTGSVADVQIVGGSAQTNGVLRRETPTNSAIWQGSVAVPRNTTLTLDTSLDPSVRSGGETRPRNIALLTCIKF